MDWATVATIVVCRCGKAWILKLLVGGCRYAKVGRGAVPQGKGRKGKDKEGVESTCLNIQYNIDRFRKRDGLSSESYYSETKCSHDLHVGKERCSGSSSKV